MVCWNGPELKSAPQGNPTNQSVRALDYRLKNYPADDAPRINVNTAAAIQLESGLNLKRSQAAALIAYRKEHGKFAMIEDVKKVPGLDAVKLEGRKDRIVF